MNEFFIKKHNNVEVVFRKDEDGGGNEFGQEYIPIISQKYGPLPKVYEWCSGPSFIGFSMYGAKLITKKLILSDIHSPVKDSIRETIVHNKIKDIKVSFYNTDKVSQVNENNIDLVVSNPPHFSGLSKVQEVYPNSKIDSRLILDQDWKIHKEFFENIHSKLSENGVVLLQENRYASSVNDFRDMIEGAGLYITDVFSITNLNGKNYNSLAYYIEIKKKKSNF